MGARRGGMLALLLLSFLLALLPAPADAGAACCKKHTMPFIADQAATPPDVFEGEPRMIADPSGVKPEWWDDEDDGEWEPEEIENPKFSWRPPMVPNPDFKPPELLESLQTELLKAMPWVVLGVVVTAS